MTDVMVKRYQLYSYYFLLFSQKVDNYFLINIFIKLTILYGCVVLLIISCYMHHCFKLGILRIVCIDEEVHNSESFVII